MIRIGLVSALAAVYVATLGSLAPLDVLAGLVFGAIFSACARKRARRERPFLPRVVSWPRTIAIVVREIFRGSVTMLRVLVGLQSWRHRGLVEVPMPSESDREVAITTWILTVSPGSVLVEMDEARRKLLVHTIDARQPAKVREDVATLHARAVHPVTA